MVGMAGLIAAALGWTMFIGFGLDYGLCFLIPGSLFFGVLWAARKMYNADPWMIDVVLRHFKYAKYYAPKPHVGKTPINIRDFTK